jgi:hypothetical protein
MYQFVRRNQSGAEFHEKRRWSYGKAVKPESAKRNNSLLKYTSNFTPMVNFLPDAMIKGWITK